MARERKPKTCTIRMTPVNIDVDETQTHYLIFVSPGIHAQQQGIGYHRSRLPKCRCVLYGGRGLRCRNCRGLDATGLGTYVGKLLWSYPAVPVKVPVEQLTEVWPQRVKQDGQRLPDALRWAGPVRGWVAV
jgi:hypothetical protein